MRRTAQAEGIEIPPEAISALARSATGSFRDALGTLEQLVTYSGSEIALADVLAVLGVADARLLEQTVDAIAAGDARAALLLLAECAEQGRDAASFAGDLEMRARELLVVQTLGEVPSELSLTPEADAALDAQAERVPDAVVVRLLEELGGAMEAVRAGADARTRLELALVKAAKPALDASMRALLIRIERLEGGDVNAVAGERELAPSQPRGPVAVADAPHVAPAAPAPSADAAALQSPPPGPTALAPTPDEPSPSAPDEPSPAPAAPIGSERAPGESRGGERSAAVEVTVASIASVPEPRERRARPAGEPAHESQRRRASPRTWRRCSRGGPRWSTWFARTTRCSAPVSRRPSRST